MKPQEITSVLRKAGFTATKVTTGYVNGVYQKIRIPGYTATEGKYTFSGGIAVDCCFCLAQKDSITQALLSAGYTVTEPRNNGILKVVK